MQNISLLNNLNKFKQSPPNLLPSSRLIYGCMRIAGDNSAVDKDKGLKAIQAAIEAGYNHFDHADIYGAGQCEQLFGELLTHSSHLRDQLIITSKAGIRQSPQRYDFSHDYLIQSVEGSLKRLNTEYLDIFLLHRPDYLFNAQALAETFKQLKREGKVKYFGVSNFSPSQVSLLQSALDEPLIINQVEINLHNISSLQDGTLDQCQQLGITPVAWCPLGAVAYPAWGNTFSKDDEKRIKDEISKQATKYDVEAWQISLAWLLKHPANICPIIGSTTPSRINAAKQALTIDYSHEDWYHLLEARNGQPLP
ncbi:aldo/keto reductase [Litorilituus lipolyticus]|uniref:Aldo/keto reductase n=1 Tax=Litorilituus lipolyticus TaxID=2491017 RepID=A0A502KZJ5_9GAMM|nr:aldo/keto reductase [Litorilituus lipolyticus]TPH15073.1 aldo/keto reductase [Litorilituus lipolyticus]